MKMRRFLLMFASSFLVMQTGQGLDYQAGNQTGS